MSDPAALVLHEHHHHHHGTPPPPPSSAPSLTPSPSPSPSPTLSRDYRKGNWTLHETLILVSAKRLDDDRRRTSSSPLLRPCAPRAAELRWKWVENYCWKNGCLRSQNQCNDKWDNLLRDYKKVRDYAASASATATYWTMEKTERKDRGLPSNLSSEVFDALTDVLSRRTGTATPTLVPSRPSTPTPPPQLTIAPPPLMAPPPPLPPPPEPTVYPSPSGEGSGSSECSGSSAKRRRVRGVGRSLARGASVLARTLLACEDRRDKRHRDRLVLEERRLRLEEERSEINRQGMASLIAAVNGLSGAIHALVADHQRGRQ